MKRCQKNGQGPPPNSFGQNPKEQHLFFRETFPKSTHWNWKEITEIPNVFVSYFAPLVTNLTTNWLRLLPCQRMLTQVYFLWRESGGENESNRFCFRVIYCQSASPDSLLFMQCPFFYSISSVFRQSTSNPTQLISFYL